MALLLGVDTGGTFTDAVILDDGQPTPETAVRASAKALTTRRDLSIGIGAAVAAVLNAAGAPPGDITLVSLSTTLATNALVEGQGGRIGLVLIGFRPADLDKAGLRQALGGDPVVLVAGGHGPFGDEQAPFDADAVHRAVSAMVGRVTGFAVAGLFAVRNPAHELAAREIIEAATALPVTCSHELSAKLDGPRRALTSVLNARLIGLLHGLITAAEGLMAARGLDAPLMVVRGDGGLVSAAFAKSRPIETILSGPAASLVGAAYLTGARDALISDIGGTTTDIAVLTDGQPKIDPAGASVGGWRTMVEAVAMQTHGLGGDSEVRLGTEGLDPPLLLGPRRVVPVSLLARAHRDVVHEALERQIRHEPPGEMDGRFARLTYGHSAGGHSAGGSDDFGSAVERELIAALAGGPVALDTLGGGRKAAATLQRLVARGVVQISGLTPSDAAHVLGLHDAWDGGAAELACRAFARRRTGRGEPVAADAKAIAQRIVETLTQRSAELLLDAALLHDGFSEPRLSRSALGQAGLRGHAGAARVDIGLGLPVVGLGASAPIYYPGVGARLRTQALVPGHAGVANAVGAVVGHVRLTRSATVSQPVEGVFRVHAAVGAVDHGAQTDFADPEAAIAAALTALRTAVSAEAAEAGADTVELRDAVERKVAIVEGRDMLVEAVVTVTATGRPRLG